MLETEENVSPPTLLRFRRDPVKLTALLYLREALLKERYEQCPQFVAVAKEFGACPREIEELLEDPRRMPTSAAVPAPFRAGLTAKRR